jgi:signal transduction histidine kinase
MTAVAAVSLVGANWAANGVEAHLIPVALLLLATPKLAGDAVRARRLRVETLEARVGLAEQETLRRVAEERLRIAREAHDVVGHELATITVTSGEIFLELLGIGMATAVLVDATVVRMVLVPALMQLFGRANWWMPRWLDRAMPRLAPEAS